jgi:hypothetical protein
MQSDERRRSGFLQAATGQITLFVVAMIVMLIFALSYLR